MARNPEPPKPATWNIYTFASKAVWLGIVEAPDEATALEKAAAEFKVPAERLMAIRRRQSPANYSRLSIRVARCSGGWNKSPIGARE
jgi:hypothetical protein